MTDQIPHPLLHESLSDLMALAAARRDDTFGTRVTYSPKVFIPLTFLCNDSCGYCTFAQPPAHVDKLFLDPDDVLKIARQGARRGCHEALFTLGERPEDRYEVARRVADRARLRLDGPLRRRDGRTRPARDRSAAARQRRGTLRRRTRTHPPVQPESGDDDRVGRPRPRSAPWCARQDARASPRHARGRRRAADPVHHRHPGRHRRHPCRPARRARSDRCDRTPATATCRR